MANNRYSSSVDEILENLQKEQSARPSRNQAVDDILANLGRDTVLNTKIQKEKRAVPVSQRQTEEKKQVLEPSQKTNLRISKQTDDSERANNKTADGLDSAIWESAVKENTQSNQNREIKSPVSTPQEKTVPVRNKEQKAPSYPLPQPQRVVSEDPQPDIQPPSLSATVQFDKEFQKFFSESIAVIPDEEPEQHPGFFARFMNKRKDAVSDYYEDDDDEDSVYIPGEEKGAAILIENPDEDDSQERQDEEALEEESEEPDDRIGFAEKIARLFHKKNGSEPQEDVYPEEEWEDTQAAATLLQQEHQTRSKTEFATETDRADAFDAMAQEQPEEAEMAILLEQEEPTVTLEYEKPAEQKAEKEFSGQVDIADVEGTEQPLWEEPEEEEERPRFRLPRLFGSKEPEETTDDAPVEFGDEDFDLPENAAEVESYLAKMRLGFGLRSGISLILGFAILYLELAVGASILPPVPALDPALSTAAWLAVQLILLLVVCAVNWKAFAKGLPGIWKHPTPDTIPALAAIGAAVQLVYSLAASKSFEPEAVTLFAAPAALLLGFNALGRRIMGGEVLRNFQLISGGTEHTVCETVKDRELAERITRNMNEPEPKLLANRPTGHFEGFLKQSFSLRASDRAAQKLSWVLLTAAVVNCFVCLFGGKGLQISLTALAGTLCLGAPLAATLLSAIPTLLMQRSAARVGAVIPGWSAVEQLSGANMVVVGAKDLFPSSCVRLHGIKTFEKQRIDLAILYAASILVEGCDTLRDVFLQIIQDRTEILYPVENLENHPGLGFTAWVDNNRMIVGNREFMAQQGVETPSIDYEQRYTKGKREPVYLAVSGRLFAMFLVSYRANLQVADTLDTLRHQGISVLLHSDDFCLNSKLAAQVYDLPESCIKVLTQEDRKALEPFTGYRPQTEGCMSHMGTFDSFVGGLTAASGAASGEKAASLVEMAGVAVSCLLSLILAFNGGIAQLSPVAVLLYAAAWGVLTLAMPLFRNY